MIHSIHLACFAISSCVCTYFKTYAFQRSFKHTSLIILRSTSANDAVSSDQLMTKNFITNIIDDDIKINKNGGRVITRFPPEPNGYLHLGHAKSILLNFGISQIYNGKTNMRFDDTNPEKEEMEYINSIIRDVKWLVNGNDSDTSPWNGEIKHASDYFEAIYEAAIYLIKNDLAYVDDLNQG